MKNGRVLALLLVAALLLSACGGQTDYDVMPQQNVLGGQSTPLYVASSEPPTPTDAVAFDPTAEEDEGGFTGGVYDEYGNAIYPGATPITIYPVDMPTPTPRPPVVFTYETYTSAKLGLSFDAPVGWLADDSAADAYRLTEPESQMREGYQAFIEVSVIQVSSNYKTSQIKTELSAHLDTIGKSFTSFGTRVAASRTLLESTGFYNQYSGTMVGGIAVAGRVHIALKDNKLYVVHISCPGNYSESYFNLHNRLRNSIKII